MHERLISRYIREHPREAKALEARLSRGGFDIKDLTKADRERTKREMARHAIVDSALLKDTVNYVAAMPAIQQEIKTAKEVYENARRVRDSIRQHLDLYS